MEEDRQDSYRQVTAGGVVKAVRCRVSWNYDLIEFDIRFGKLLQENEKIIAEFIKRKGNSVDFYDILRQIKQSEEVRAVDNGTLYST